MWLSPSLCEAVILFKSGSNSAARPVTLWPDSSLDGSLSLSLSDRSLCGLVTNPGVHSLRPVILWPATAGHLPEPAGQSVARSLTLLSSHSAPLRLWPRQSLCGVVILPHPSHSLCGPVSITLWSTHSVSLADHSLSPSCPCRSLTLNLSGRSSLCVACAAGHPVARSITLWPGSVTLSHSGRSLTVVRSRR